MKFIFKYYLDELLVSEAQLEQRRPVGSSRNIRVAEHGAQAQHIVL
jgi:hypothetical protein